MTISANIICKNEIDNIVKCINSVLPYCDEVIVVDTGSTDGTVEAIKSIGNSKIKLFHKEWNDNFADMRNFAITKSTNDWVLVIDGDMELIKYEQPDFTADYYICNIQIESSTKNIFQFPLIMLFNKDGVKYEGARHSIIDFSLKGKKGESTNITFSHPELEHEEIVRKMNRNLEVHLEQLNTEPDNITVNYHLCRTYYYLRQFDNAIMYGDKVLISALNKEVKAITSILMFLSYSLNGKEGHGIPYLLHALRLVPKQIFGRFLMFQLLLNARNFELAKDTLEEIIILSKTKQSDLPADYYMNDKQLEILQNDLTQLKNKGVKENG